MEKNVGKRDSEITEDDVQNVALVALEAQILELQAQVKASSDEAGKVWVALSGIAGLDGLARGMAGVVEVFAPLKQLVPPVVAGDLDPRVGEANLRMRKALGLVLFDRKNRPLPGGLRSFDRLPTADWDFPVGFIGQAVTETNQEHRS